MNRFDETIMPYRRWTSSYCGVALQDDKFRPICGEALDWKDSVETDFQWKSLPSDGKFYGYSIKDKCPGDEWVEEEEEIVFNIGDDTYKVPYQVLAKIFKKHLEDNGVI